MDRHRPTKDGGTMFEAFRHLRGPGRRTGHGRSPALENLEARAVPAIIGGMIYYDANGDGLLEQGERGLSAVPLQLRDSSGTVVASASSGADGRYQFTQRNTPPLPGAL